MTTAAVDDSEPDGLAVLAPVTGRVVPMADVPDPVFAASMVGPGLAIDPAGSEGRTIVAVAPITGTVVTLHPHAYAIQNADGAGVLTHLGIDTVQMNGEGFETKVAAGDVVEAGDAVVTWDPSAVVASGRSAIVPVVALEATPSTLGAPAVAASTTAASTVGSVGEVVDVGTPLYVWRR